MPERPNIDIRPDHWEIVRNLLQKNVPQHEVWAFGSRAKWTAKDHSDLDLAVITSQPMALRVSASLSDDFSESDLPWKVDVVDWATTSESFRKIIARDKVVVQAAGRDCSGGQMAKGAELDQLIRPKLGGVGTSSEWQATTLGEILVLQRGMDLPVQDRKGGRIPIVASTGVVGFHNEAPVKGPGVVIGRSGSIGGGQYITSSFWPLNTTLWVKDFKGNDPRYCYYLLRSIDFSGMNAGSGVPTLNRNHLHPMPMNRPPLSEQTRIAEMLGALDDRITLLRETNATLEAIAQALFKSWFVDFDPVRAKMEGRSPEGMDEATAALFPDGFEESELGLVPRGWGVGTVGDFARQHKGSINPLQNPEVMFEHFSLPAFDNQQMPVSELGTAIKSNKTSVPPDAVLLSKLNPHIPRIWLPAAVGHHAVCSTEFLVFLPAHESGASREFIYCAFTTAKFKELLCQLVTGTSNSHQRVKPDGISTMSAVIPDKVAIEAFGSIVEPLFERIGHNRSKAQTLSTLRDTLLPRLISGQLRLPVALEELEAA